MQLEIPTFKSCCGLSLKTGSFVIGSLFLLISILIFMDNLVSFIAHEENFGTIHFTALSLVRVVLFQIAFGLQIIFSIYLIIGLWKGLSYFILSWIIFQTSCITTNLLILIFFNYHNFFVIIEDMFLIGIDGFTSLIVYSYYLKLKKNADPGF